MTDTREIVERLRARERAYLDGGNCAYILEDAALDASTRELIERLTSQLAEARDADDYVDQLNVLCEDFGCEAGSDRLAWLHDQLSELSRLRARVAELEADRDRIERNRDMWKGQCERQAERLSAINALQSECVEALTRQRQIDMDGCEVGVSRQAVDEVYAALTVARALTDKGEA